MKKIWSVCLFFVLQSSLYADFSDFEIKELKDFKTLGSYKSIDLFDDSVAKYINACMNSWGGSSAGSRCLIGYQLWDRELNIYYKKLYNSLKNKQKSKLKLSQKAWLKSRDISRGFITDWINKEYTEPGTMFNVIRSQDGDYAITSIVRQRALTLRRWYKLFNHKNNNEPESSWYKY